MADVIWVEPGRLRLPPSRRSGVDPVKLAEQLRNYGASYIGMPPLELTEGSGREYMINDGVLVPPAFTVMRRQAPRCRQSLSSTVRATI